MARPKNAMTRRRRMVLEVIISSSERLSWCEIARRCGLHDFRDAKRIVRELHRIDKNFVPASYHPMHSARNCG
jgi:hypothetical protein